MDGAHESFTVLPSLSPRLPAVPPPPPTPADTRVAPRAVAHKEATAFVILGEITIPEKSATGRVSPFRGKGFRAPSPPSPTSKIPVLAGKSAPASPAHKSADKNDKNAGKTTDKNGNKIEAEKTLKSRQQQGKSAPTSPKKAVGNRRKTTDSPSRVPVSVKSKSNVDLPSLKEPSNKRVATRTLPKTPRRIVANGNNKTPAPTARRLAADGKPAPTARSRLNNNPVSTEVKAGSVGAKNAAPRAAVRRSLAASDNVAALAKSKKPKPIEKTTEEEMNRKNAETKAELIEAPAAESERERVIESAKESARESEVVGQIVTSVTETVPEIHKLHEAQEPAEDNSITVVELITPDEELGRLMTTPKVTVSNGKVNGSLPSDEGATKTKRKIDMSKIRNGMSVLRAVKGSSAAIDGAIAPADGAVVEETEETVRGAADVEVEAGNHTVTFSSPEIHPVSPKAPPKSLGRPRGQFRDRFRDAICSCCGRGRLRSGKVGILDNALQETTGKIETDESAGPKWYDRLCRRKKKEPPPPRLAKPMKSQGKNFFSKLNCCKKKGKMIRKPKAVSSGPGVWRKIFCLDRAFCAKCCSRKTEAPAVPQGASRLEMKRSSSVPAPTKPTGLPKLDLALVEHGSVMKGAIPALPICLAWMCLILNIIIPGTGTIISGFLCMCFGKPRFSVNDSGVARLGSLCVNLIVGISQIFTVIFCLVGWGWSIWWGVIMVKVARKHRRIKLAEKATEEAGGVAATPNPDKDAERGGEP